MLLSQLVEDAHLLWSLLAVQFRIPPGVEDGCSRDLSDRVDLVFRQRRRKDCHIKPFDVVPGHELFLGDESHAFEESAREIASRNAKIIAGEDDLCVGLQAVGTGFIELDVTSHQSYAWCARLLRLGPTILGLQTYIFELNNVLLLDRLLDPRNNFHMSVQVTTDDREGFERLVLVVLALQYLATNPIAENHGCILREFSVKKSRG